MEKSNISNSVLIRMYFGNLVSANDPYRTLSIPGDVLLFHKLGELGFGPKLLGVFDGGRLEEYIPSHTVTDAELLDPTIQEHIARKLARYHSLKLPLGIDAVDQVGVIDLKTKKIANFEEEYLNHPNILKSTANPMVVVSFDFASEVEWLRKVRSKLNAPLVFSLNDLNRMNVLVRDQPDLSGHRVTLIDYEFSATNYRGNDLGCHLSFGWACSLSPDVPNFATSIGVPPEEVRRNYIEHYLNETSKFKVLDPELDNVEQLLFEVDFAIIANLMLFLVWFIAPDTKCYEHSTLHEHFLVSCSCCFNYNLCLFVYYRAVAHGC